MPGPDLTPPEQDQALSLLHDVLDWDTDEPLSASPLDDISAFLRPFGCTRTWTRQDDA